MNLKYSSFGYYVVVVSHIVQKFSIAYFFFFFSIVSKNKKTHLYSILLTNSMICDISLSKLGEERGEYRDKKYGRRVRWGGIKQQSIYWDKS